MLEVRVWNDTVANLTLMALGSSAPEILLSIIEILGNNFYAGALGPGRSVLCEPVCVHRPVWSLAQPEIKRRKETNVFH